MRNLRPLLAALAIPACVIAAAPDPPAGANANDRDMRRAPIFAEREADWRNGPIVYQVLLDRFAPPADLDAKRGLYPAPKKLHPWTDKPTRGTYVESAEVWSHEIDFWGGDFASLRTKMDYIQKLGVDVLYLNPIHDAYTNHKYDARDYFKVSPEFGTRDDVTALATDVHNRGMRLMLDGVFNHMGRNSPYFQDALKDEKSDYRGWYYFGPDYKLGYRAWVNVPNLPEVNLDNEDVRKRLWLDSDSVIQGYLRDGVDGWRLDVAFDIGFRHLAELTRSAHTAKDTSLIIGEVWNYPEEWMPSLDGMMNMTARETILQLCRGGIEAPRAGRAFERMVEDTGLDPMLKSWIILDNHDTQRLRNSLPDEWRARMAQVLQFTLPGAPCVYYGVELGMPGGDDPEQRAPMDWSAVRDDNPDLKWMRALIAARRDSRALRIGDFRLLDSAKSFAFLRRTDRAEDLRLVVVNPTDETTNEFVVLRDSKVMSYAEIKDMLSDAKAQTMAGTIWLNMPPRSFRIYAPVIPPGPEYTPYKRVQ